MKKALITSLLLALALPISANAASSAPNWTFSSEELSAALADDSDELIAHTWTCIAKNSSGRRFIKTGASQAQAWLRAFGDCGQGMSVHRAMRDCNVTRCFRTLR